ETGGVERTPQIQTDVRACADKMIARFLLQKECFGAGIEEYRGQAYSHSPLHVPVRIKAVFSAGIVEIEGIDAQPAAQNAVAAVQIESRKPEPAVGDQQAITDHQLTPPLAQPIADIDSRRAGPLQRRGRQMQQV